MIVPSFFNDSYFDEMFNSLSGSDSAKALMRTDVKEIGPDYLLEIEMPGFEKDEIHAELEKGYLTISGVHAKKIDVWQIHSERTLHGKMCKKLLHW